MEEKIKYRYFANGRTGTRQVYPINGQGLSVSYTENDEKLDYDVKISEKLKFAGQDFLWLYTIEKTIYRCDFVNITIEKFCSGTWELFFFGRVSLNSGDPWNLDIGFVELEIAESAAYDCFDSGGDTDYNIMSYVSNRVSATTLTGTLEEQSFNLTSDDAGYIDLFPGEPDPFSKGWVQRFIRYNYNYALPGPGESGGEVYSVYVIWVREVTVSLDGSPLPPPWVLISDDGTHKTYARSPILYNQTYGLYDPSRPNDSEVSYSVLSQAIDNGLPLRKVIEALLLLICPQLTLESDFFQWNPITPTNINYVTESISKVKNLILFQKSDVKRPNTTNNSSIATTNLSDLINDLCKVFQLKYSITETGKFKIEHVSYYDQKGTGIDTTLSEYLRFTAGNRSYSYDKDKIPKYETFRFMDTSYGDFAGQNISYSGSCAGQGDSKDIAYNVENITTDVQLCLNNPAPDSAVSDDGFVLIACDDAGAIIREASIMGGNVVNNSLAWAQLHRDYYRYNRAQKTFTMNGVLTTALTVKPTKLQSEFTIPFCCQVFDPKLFVKTSLGLNGTIKTAKYDIYGEKLNLSILHPADEGLIENNAPITIGDTAQTFKDFEVIIDVLANDTDSDGYIDPTSLTILMQPTNGIAVITDDYKIKYTPNTGFSGMDIVIYNVKDNYKDPSPNTLVNITVKPGTPIIKANDDAYAIVKNKNLSVVAPGVLSNDTGPSALTAMAETKPTTGGGSVLINSDGSITYTPASGFTGTDTFEYTAKDINNNTSKATVTITVFEPLPVYVLLREETEGPKSIIEDCGQGLSIVGQRQTKNIYLDFFSDAAFTIPLDVTNYSLYVNVKYINTNHANGDAQTSYTPSYLGVGTTMQIEENYETSYMYTGCNNMGNINYDVSLSLQPGSGYNI